MKCDGNLQGSRLKTLVLKNVSQNSLELGRTWTERQFSFIRLIALRAARSIFVHAPGILNFHGDTHKLDSSNYKALVLTHFLAHLRCPR